MTDLQSYEDELAEIKAEIDKAETSIEVARSEIAEKCANQIEAVSADIRRDFERRLASLEQNYRWLDRARRQRDILEELLELRAKQ